MQSEIAQLSLDIFFFNSNAPKVIVDHDLFVLKANESFLSAFSKSNTKEFFSLLQIIHDEDKDILKSFFINIPFSNGNKTLTIRLLQNNANFNKCNLTLIGSSDIFYFIELTASFDSQSENSVYDIFSEIKFPIYVKSKQGNFKYINSEFQDVFSLTTEVLHGRTENLFLKNAKEVERIKKSEKEVLFTKGIVQTEHYFELSDERDLQLLAYRLPFTDPTDNEECIMGLYLDISPLKQLEVNLKKDNEELEKFVYHSSHDLKAPLNSIEGLLNLIEMETDREILDHCFTKAKGSIHQLKSFISDLTDYSRNNSTEIHKVKINFRELLHECLEHLKYMDKAELLKVDLNVRQISPFYSDPVRLRTIFMNLISNAIKYSRQEGNSSYLNINVNLKASNAIILLEDNGIGIEKEFQSKIFDMFFRASTTNSGSGIGLYIVKQVLERLGGEISLQSEKNKGTAFRLVIPNLIDR